MDPPYGKELKLVATDALQSTEEELPPVSLKEAAEVVAKAAVAALAREDPTAEEQEGGLGGEDEHWAMAAYMEGISEEARGTGWYCEEAVGRSICNDAQGS